MIRSVCFISLVILFCCTEAAHAAPNYSKLNMALVRLQADAILHCQTPEGIIAMDSKRSRAVPYFANFAAIGLIRAAGLTDDSKYLDAVRRYLDWHASAMSKDGTISDYAHKDGALQPTGDYDSSDSYPATYLCASWAYYGATNDRKWLEGKHESFARALKGIELTLQPDGLTYAKPTYKVKYLMDNLEVWQGEKAGANLAAVLGDTALAESFSSHAKACKQALMSFWLPDKGYFSMAISENGDKVQSFEKWYPDGMANAMVAAVLLDPKDPKSRDLVKKTMTAFPAGGDWVWWSMARKFGYSGDAARAYMKMLTGVKYSNDFGQLLRTYDWDSDKFFYCDENVPLDAGGRSSQMGM